MPTMRRTLFVPAVLILAVTIGIHDARAASESLALLRAEIGSRPIRVTSTGERFVVKHPALTRAGVDFDQRDIEGMARWNDGNKVYPAPPPTPITWGTIDRIEVQQSGFPRGAFVGAVLLCLGTLAAVQYYEAEDAPVLNLAPVAALPVGALVGGAVGSLFPTWRHVWPRPSESPPRVARST